MRIAVTGGDGFVGRHLCDFLSIDHEIHVIDNFRFGFQRIAHFQDRKVSVHRCDLRDPATIAQVVSAINPSITFHLAAIHYIPECEDDPYLAISTNVLGTINLMQALTENTRLVFVSTGAVYAPDLKPHSEDTSVIGPCDVYGYSKLHAEQYLSYLATQKKISLRIVRLFNVIGPGETNPHIIPEIIQQLHGGNLKIRLGNIDTHRDYIYVKDVAEGLAKIGMADGNRIRDCEILNLGTSKHYSVAEIVEILSGIIHDKIVVERDEKKVRKSDRPMLCADLTKLVDRVCWQPRYDIITSLEETWKNPDI